LTPILGMARKKKTNSHLAPTVIICITNDETGKQKEKPYGEVTMVNNLIEMAG